MAEEYPIKLLEKVLSTYPAFGWINPTESRMFLLNFSLKNLMHNETWEGPFTFKPKKTGEDQKLEFLLYKNPFNKSVYGEEDEEGIYRSLHLWVDVK
jgi:uncharacterized membrane protein